MSAVRITQSGANPPAGAVLAADLQAVVKRWRFKPLVVNSKAQSFDVVMVMRRIVPAHVGDHRYICSSVRAPRKSMPRWYVYLPQGSQDVRPFAVGVAARSAPNP